MKKVGLQDMKKRNIQIILDFVAKLGPLSRIDIARYTELSPSTVTSLVNELLRVGLLVQLGTAASSGGRKPIELSINGAYGEICIVEIRRKTTRLHFYNLNLTELKTVALSDQSLTGNDLLASINSALHNYYLEAVNSRKKPMGFGLLFHEDVQPSDYNVIFSTSLSSASITLKEALLSLYRIPIIEEHISALSLLEPLPTYGQTSANNAHINIGTNILISIPLDGKPITLKNGRFADATPFFTQIIDGTTQMQVRTEQLAHLITFLCTLFPLDTIFLSGKFTEANSFLRTIRKSTEAALAAALPKIMILDQEQQPSAKILVQAVRGRALETISF